MLAHSGHEIVNGIVAAGLRPLTPNTITTEYELRTTLADIRRQGFVVCCEHLDRRSVAVAAPLLNSAREIVAAISVVIRSDRDPTPLIPSVVKTADTISRHLA